ncbi:hypothetical protein LV716_10910 [Flagellimonas sp. HMM57]|uniref:peptide-N-glycosidase F-related protein n=1 Tax=unclassified Flagellimonas TaxID=2644544 RepID=UPI001969C31B|nr:MULTISPECIES: peptide-N-glycosidase F-related protein [unclassified Flagellimonas]UII74774.1 hypothetical protein LV716_10910 [Flagellimonas sp. HMM57]
MKNIAFYIRLSVFKKNLIFGKFIHIVGLLNILMLFGCGGDKEEPEVPVGSTEIIVSGSLTAFSATEVLTESLSKTIKVKGNNLTGKLSISTSNGFKVSLDDNTFSNTVSLEVSDVNNKDVTIFVAFTPSENATGTITGTLSFTSSNAKSISMDLQGEGINSAPRISMSESDFTFDDTTIDQTSSSVISVITAKNLTKQIQVNAPDGFQISLDDITYAPSISIPSNTANGDTNLYIKFIPNKVKRFSGGIAIMNEEVTDTSEINVVGTGIPDYANAVVHNYITFDKERLAFGGGFEQRTSSSFTVHSDVSNIAQVKMFVKLTCPDGGCDEWDVYANVSVKDDVTNDWFELGRFITPYWNDNSQLPRGFEFDVTDFKTLLTGTKELQIFTECWNAKGYEVTVDFDYIEGIPDYKYYTIARVLNYNENSIAGVPYGKSHNLDLDKSITIPDNAESTHLRTIISGWGHATPNDSGGRGCAEWCFRNHNVRIDGEAMFSHNMGPLGCADNPVSNQDPGNWKPDRAGWCPGMEVPVRKDYFDDIANTSFNFEYDFQDWSNNGGNGDAFYAISTYIIVKSDTPLAESTVN